MLSCLAERVRAKHTTDHDRKLPDKLSGYPHKIAIHRSSSLFIFDEHLTDRREAIESFTEFKMEQSRLISTRD
jgi:hypothetical protein